MRVFACNVENCNAFGALLSEIGGPEQTGRYIFIYIDLNVNYVIFVRKLTSRSDENTTEQNFGNDLGSESGIEIIIEKIA
jgi:hypothetical protein